VAGSYNIPQGTSLQGAVNPDDFLAIFGNGTNSTPSNAVTISNSGYLSDAFDPGTTAPTKVGTMYKTNTVEDWVNVPAGNALFTASFGGLTAPPSVTGTYTFTLHNLNQDGTPITAYTANSCSIVATIIAAATGAPGLITVTPITALGTFTVTTWTAGAAPAPSPFFSFMVDVILK